MPLSQIIVAADIDSGTMANKLNFTDTTRDLIISMCRGVEIGQGAIIAVNDMADIQVVNQLFSNVSDVADAVDLDCGGNCTSPTKLVLGASLESAYSEYSCEDTTCAGKLFSIFCLQLMI